MSLQDDWDGKSQNTQQTRQKLGTFRPRLARSDWRSEPKYSKVGKRKDEAENTSEADNESL